MKIVIQGVEGSFHDMAAQKYFGKGTEIVSAETFAECFKYLEQSKAEYAVVAIENSLYGSINTVYDLLLKHSAIICGEIYIRIEQCLIGLPNASIKSIKEVHSHPVALAQCEDYLDRNMPAVKRLEHHDTAASVVDIKYWDDPTKAAIASKEAAKLHGMKILGRGIEDNKQNYTRFVVLSKHNTQPINANKASLIITTDHTPGALRDALNVLADQDINLTKLQSRPIIGKAWHYMFYMDIDASACSKEFIAAQEQLARQGCTVNILGSYKAGN